MEDNEEERSNYINRFVRTLQSPNLVIKSIENGKTYNYYVKSFSSENNKISGHVQVIKKCSDGSFYVTNHHLHNSKFNKALKNGQIIFDLSDLSAVQNAPDNNIINYLKRNFNPTEFINNNIKVHQNSLNVGFMQIKKYCPDL